MIGHAKSRRCQLFQTIDAFLKIKDTLALLAMKVMVMPFIRSLIARRLTRYLHAADKTIFGKSFE